MQFRQDNLEDNYEVHEDLGSGQFAVVRRCVERSTGQQYAAKFITKRLFTGSQRGAKRADIEREVEVLTSIGGHANIISLHEVYETQRHVVLVLELVSGGELFHHLCSKEYLVEEEASSFVKQILLGLSYMHSKHIAHLDLKPENVMLQRPNCPHVKLIDFGLSRKIPPKSSVKDLMGTEEFVAPETINYDGMTMATDMWAVGVITYILLSGSSPFLGDTRQETFCNITSVKYDLNTRYLEKTSALAKDFIRRLLVRDPRKRYSVEQCLKHPWIQTAVRLVVLCVRLVKQHGPSVTSQPSVAAFDAGTLVSGAAMCASGSGDVSSLQDLSRLARCNWNQCNAQGQSAVHVAAASGQLNALKFLVQEGADLTLLDKNGDSALHLAAAANQVKVLEYIVTRMDPNILNKSKETALHVAVQMGCLDAALCILMSTNVDINLRDSTGNTPLHLACWHGYTMIASLLCNFKPDVRLKNKSGETALMCAAARGHLDCVFTLKSAGASLTDRDTKLRTALHLAIEHHHTDVALPLIEAMGDLNNFDEAGNSPLHVACKEGLTDVVRNLCQRGVDVNHLNERGQAPLHIACKENHLELVKLLCLSECNVNLKNKDGLTGEMIAAARNYTEICDTLKRVKQESARTGYVKQLIPCPNQPLRRVKMKLFGHSGVGKSRLLEALRTGLLGNLLRRFSESASVIDDEPSEVAPGNGWRKAVIPTPVHAGYTRGIEVTCSNIPGCGEFSTWEFSGYPSYHFLYDRFVGNPHCIHLVLFRLTDATEIKYNSVIFWMNLLKSCFCPEKSIGKSGTCQNRAMVVLIATHVDLGNDVQQSPDGEWLSSEADALLNTIKLRFCQEFLIHDKIILVDSLQPGCSGIRTLKSLLNLYRQQIMERLPKSSGFLDCSINSLMQVRKNSSAFPVLRWPDFVKHLHAHVNPLASELHCHLLSEQLQHLGEVVCVHGGDETDSSGDFIVLNANWFGHDVIGKLLSHDFLRVCRPTGIYSADELLLLFPAVSNVAEFTRLLEAIGLCALIDCDEEDEVTFEFAPLNFSRQPDNHWEPTSKQMVYGGVRLIPRRGMDHMMRSIFLRVQNNLRRCWQLCKDPLDLELVQWKGGSKMIKGLVEGVLTLAGKEQYIELKVRAPVELDTDCFYFFEDTVGMVEQTVFEVAPGMLLERHFLSPADLAQHSCSVATYPPNRILEMQLEEDVLLVDQSGRRELFLDVVCFGSRDIAMSLTLGIDLKISAIPNAARRELANLLDPVDTMGRDWSILGAHLGLSNQLAEIESACLPETSKTDRVLSEWYLRNKDTATVGALLRCLKTMGRQDAVDILYRSVALYLFVPSASSFPIAGMDSGVASHNSRSTFGTPDRSFSTLSS